MRRTDGERRGAWHDGPGIRDSPTDPVKPLEASMTTVGTRPNLIESDLRRLTSEWKFRQLTGRRNS
jgi:hypothetical protein